MSAVPRTLAALPAILLPLLLTLAPLPATASPNPPPPLKSLIDTGKLDEAIAAGEARLARGEDPEAASAVAEACERKAMLLAKRDAPAEVLLALVDRGLKAERTPKLLKFRGHILVAMGGREVQAYEAYEEAVERGADGKDLGDSVAGMAKVYQAIAPTMCRLTVTTQPPGAGVRVDSATLTRKTPAKLWLTRGTHTVRAGEAGQPGVAQTVDCGPEPVAVHLDLPQAAPAQGTGGLGGAAATPEAEVVAPQGEPGRAVGWALAGGGLAVGLAGLGLYLATVGDIDQYNADLKADASGLVSGTSYQEASAAQTSINNRVGAAIGLGAVGLAALGGGTWWLLRAPASAAVVPSGRGVALVVRF